MQSVNRIVKYILLHIFLVPCMVTAQENAPFSRYGLGDVFPAENIAIRGMGGAGVAYMGNAMVNNINPASYGGLTRVNYDLGVSIDTRNLISRVPAAKYGSVNFAPAYLQLGLPISRKRHIGVNFGLRPVTRINYSVSEKILQVDTLENIYEGDGGLNQVFAGIGKRWKKVSVGVNGGFQWGSKDIGTKKVFTSDSILYYRSLSIDTTRFWGLFVNPGFSATIKVKENKVKDGTNKYYLTWGASGFLQQTLKANTTSRIYTYSNGANGEVIPIDTIKNELNILGNIEIPMSYRTGLLLEKTVNDAYTQWRFSADYEAAAYSGYRFYDQPDQLNDAWKIRFGGEYTPNLLSTRSGWDRTTYRLGFYTGEDYINADGNGYNVWAVTAGFGFYIKKFDRDVNKIALINTAFEYGKRGSQVNNITENFFKLSVGLTFTDYWFFKRRFE